MNPMLEAMHMNPMRESGDESSASAKDTTSNADKLEKGLLAGVHNRVDATAKKHGGDSVLGKAIAHSVNGVIDKEVAEKKSNTKASVKGLSTGPKTSRNETLNPFLHED